MNDVVGAVWSWELEVGSKVVGRWLLLLVVIGWLLCVVFGSG